MIILLISPIFKIERFRTDPHRLKIQDKFLEASELSDLLSGMKVTKWRKLTEFLALSGLRFGEAAALELSDVDLKERIIHVNKTYVQGHDLVTSTKTQQSVFCQVLFPEKSVGIPFFQQGIFPAFSGHYASLRMRACSIR